MAADIFWSNDAMLPMISEFRESGNAFGSYESGIGAMKGAVSAIIKIANISPVSLVNAPDRYSECLSLAYDVLSMYAEVIEQDATRLTELGNRLRSADNA